MKQMGASGFVHKSANMDSLLEAVERLLEGKTWFHDHLSTPGESGSDDGDDGDRLMETMPRLGPRQLEVLHLMGQGATNKLVAEKLGISENTVKSHMRAIFDALGVRTRTACVRKAQMLGLL